MDFPVTSRTQLQYQGIGSHLQKAQLCALMNNNTMRIMQASDVSLVCLIKNIWLSSSQKNISTGAGFRLYYDIFFFWGGGRHAAWEGYGMISFAFGE